MAKTPAKPMTEKQDDALDRKAGIKENSPRDMKLDKSRRITEDMFRRAPKGPKS